MKPTMLMITGWAHGAESLRPLADELAADFTVQIRTAAELLAAQTLPPAEFVIGWSLGGMLALERLPATCKKLVLISSTAKFCAAADYPCGVAEKVLRRMILQLHRDPAAVLAEFQRNVHAPRPAPDHALCAADAPDEGLDYLLHTDLRPAVPSIQLPVLLLHGDEDRIIPPQASEWLAQHLPQAAVRNVPSQGHALDALAIAPHIRHFLATEFL